MDINKIKLKVKSVMSSIADFQNRLRKNQNKRAPRFRKQNTTCYRLFDRDIPEYPVTIDRYEDAMLFSIYEGKHGLAMRPFDAMIEYARELLGIHPHKVFERTRSRRIAGQQHEKLDTAQQRFSVRENGLQFWVNLSDYTDTGLFLDHRQTRAMVGEMAAGRDVLNLFCYTGSFTVYAAAGKARSTCSVDLSNTYLDWTKRNLALNGFAAGDHTLIKTDVMKYLYKAEKMYDLAIVDPPTFSNSKSTSAKVVFVS